MPAAEQPTTTPRGYPIPGTTSDARVPDDIDALARAIDTDVTTVESDAEATRSELLGAIAEVDEKVQTTATTLQQVAAQATTTGVAFEEFAAVQAFQPIELASTAIDVETYGTPGTFMQGSIVALSGYVIPGVDGIVGILPGGRRPARPLRFAIAGPQKTLVPGYLDIFDSGVMQTVPGGVDEYRVCLSGITFTTF